MENEWKSIQTHFLKKKNDRNEMDVICHSSALGCRMGVEDVVLLLLGHAAFTPSPRGTNYLWAWEATLGVYSGLGRLFWEAALGNELRWGTDSLHAWGYSGHTGLGGYSGRLLSATSSGRAHITFGLGRLLSEATLGLGSYSGMLVCRSEPGRFHLHRLWGPFQSEPVRPSVIIDLQMKVDNCFRHDLRGPNEGR